MYCQSCQTKLSPRDQSCPTCGRRVSESRDLGGGSGDAESKSFPLPPAQAVDEDSQSSMKPVTDSPRKPAPSRSASSSKSRESAPPKRREAKPEPRRGGRRKAARPEPTPAPAEEAGAGFGLRPRDVLGLLAEKPSLIEPGLEIHSEDGEDIGIGFPTAIGDIDLLARDDSGGWVIVCVAEPDQGKDIVADLLQRIGWVRRHLGQSGEEVRGIVLLDEMPDDLGYAAAAVSDTVEFKLYQLELTFESVIL